MANNTISLRSLLEKEKLNGINFLDWFRNLRIVLKQERKEYVIKEPVPNEPDVGCLVLATMTPELQKQHEYIVAYEMIQNLKEILKRASTTIELKERERKMTKSKGIGKTKPKGKEALKPKGGVSKDGKCFHCGKPGHWKRNCHVYLEEVKKAKAVEVSTFLTPPDTPRWNGVYERRNRTLLDMVRSMMSHNDLSTSFWGHALETTAFTLNRVSSKSVQKTPHEMWTEKRPNMSFMKVWGCKAYVKHQMSTKLEPKSQKFTFVGYPKKTKGYYFYNENKVFVART
ncbi:hypothetical protein V6N13_074461 [Hibiscus sabdariffa]